MFFVAIIIIPDVINIIMCIVELIKFTTVHFMKVFCHYIINLHNSNADVEYWLILLVVRSSRKHQNSYSYSEYLTFAVGSNVLTYTHSTHAHKDEGGVDQVTLEYLRAFELDDLLPPFLIQITRRR